MDWIDDLSRAWSREYPDFDTASFPPLVRLARLGLLIERFQQEVVAPFEISAGDYGVLAALRRAGRPYALKPSNLYVRLHRSSGGMTKTLKKLEEQGLVERSPDPNDGRGSLVSLTPAGLALQDEIFQAFLLASQSLLAPLSESRLSADDEALRELLAIFEERLSR
ncbi:MAG: MarR family transcriptional regulator [Deltaproteobacteria bacterium]|nr:MarR family transcriptional regulator [Deltaproteobacteria bacterium]MBW2500714.1 MarR family transcriptional regulator [Deltaproteobacteria bacterium]